MDTATTAAPGPAVASDLRLSGARRDAVALAIVSSAILLFIGNGSVVMPGVLRALAGHGVGPDELLANTLLLNIALVIFGWRRYNELAVEVRQRREAERQARELAERDPLTGCLNRRSIAPQTDALIAAAAPTGRAVAFLMLDLDNFKQINDVHGHLAGDTLLREAATRLRRLLPHDALLGRLGGDEFACVVPFDPARSQSIDELALRLIAAVAAPVPHGPAELETTISVGITRTDAHAAGHDAQALLHMADIAMYQAKHRGRNRYFWFEPTMEAELRLRNELEAGVRRGIAQGEFVPFYEKQIDLASGKLVGFEMLARWQSPKLGLVSPEVFIPVAEEIGLIADLSESLIRQALSDARGWDPSLSLSVNISPVQLRDPWFAQRLLKLLLEANFPPQRLDLEITENCLHDNLALVRSMVSSLRNQGIRVTLDDFGTGYSSLSQLHALPIDRIKIDRSFIAQLPGNPDCATIVKSIASLGHGLGLPITAEGVESAEVLAELEQFGAINAQGYLFGMPATADDTHAELARLDLLLDPAEIAAPLRREA